MIAFLSQVWLLSISGTSLNVLEDFTVELPPSLSPWNTQVYFVLWFPPLFVSLLWLLYPICPSPPSFLGWFLHHRDSPNLLWLPSHPYFPVTSFDLKLPPSSFLQQALHQRWAWSGHRFFFIKKNKVFYFFNAKRIRR